jgi:type III secretion protein W
MQQDDVSQVQERAFDLMKELVTITGEKWVGASRFAALADRKGLKEPAVRIFFLTGVKELMRTMPELVFEDPEIRQSILNAAQEALDAAIDLEED